MEQNISAQADPPPAGQSPAARRPDGAAQSSSLAGLRIEPILPRGGLPPSRIRLNLLPEGWVFLVILTFVAVGAILRNVNLLIILAGMMLAPLMINCRVGRQMLSCLDFQRLLPSHIHVGSFVTVQWRACNRRDNLNSWNVSVEERIIRLRTTAGDEGWRFERTPPQLAQLLFPHINAGQTEFASYRLMFETRGIYQLDPALVATSFPFGLIRARRKLNQPCVFYVAPRLGHLSPIWDQRIRSVAFGNEALQRKRGIEEEEFYALRRWRAGDHLRHVHWRSTAKLGYPMIKEHDQRTNRDFALVLDLYGDSPDSGYDDGSRVKCETILSFAATVFAGLGNAVQGQIGLGICGRELELISGRNHHELFKRFMRSLATARPRSQTSFDSLVTAITAVSQSVSSGTPVYVVSPRGNPFAASGDVSLTTPESQAAGPNWQRAVGKINWLQVGSTEFDELFQVSRTADVESAHQLQVRWEGRDD